ncbi:hypothetical protein PybrP1_011845 [[Pythium] brassicae (nom. inval.)]|nr:hypothetical protein PybrP1_011845 [[Pythium] brassicae (nom. inval.)]
MAGKARRSADATSASGKALRLVRESARATKQYTVTATSAAFAQKFVRPAALALVLLVLVWLALTFLGRFQLWMTAAGVCMVLLSVASAVQEFKHPAKSAQTYQDLLDATVESCSADKISLPSMEPTATKPVAVKAAAKSAAPVVASHRRGSKPVATDASAASPAIVTNPVLLESGGVSELKTAPKPATRTRHKSEECMELTSVSRGRRRSTTTTSSELSSKLLVLHCGTVIDIEGSHGFLIPHDLGFKTAGKKKSKASVAPSKLPLVIPFDLNEDEAAVRQELAVGRTVEFAFSEFDGGCKVCALHVTPVASDGEIERSRHALLSCKQAREQSFAKAMCGLKAISPRHEPVKHVDLIKYAAEQLDDHEVAINHFP